MNRLLRLAFCGALLLAEPSTEPQYTKDNQLILPANYREWIFLTSGSGMNYGSSEEGAAPAFDNVFVRPESYRAFLKTGTWPDKTMFILEIRASDSHGSINKAGRYQTGLSAVEAEVKDASRFPGKWAFFGFGKESIGKPFPADSRCNQCHAKSGAVDNTFVQFYPMLIDVARAKGTYRE